MQIFPHIQPVLNYYVVAFTHAPLASLNVHLSGQKHNCQRGSISDGRCRQREKGTEKREQIIKGYKRRKGWQKREEKGREREETSLPFGVKRGPIDSGVMSLVLAGVQRDRSRGRGTVEGEGESQDLIPNSKQHHFCRHQNQHLRTPIKARWPSARLMTNPPSYKLPPYTHTHTHHVHTLSHLLSTC